MNTLLEKAIVEALFSYMEKAGIKQIELAKRLGWSPSDLNSVLKGKKGIGKNRQTYLEEKLGRAFKNEMLAKMSELSATEREKPGRVAETFSEYLAGRFALTDTEQRYVKKLLAILRGKNRQADFLIRTSLDVLSLYRKDRQQVSESHIRRIMEG